MQKEKKRKKQKVNSIINIEKVYKILNILKWVVGIPLLLWLAVKIYRLIVNPFDPQGLLAPPGTTAVDQLQTDLKEKYQKGIRDAVSDAKAALARYKRIKPSYDDAYYKFWAEDLYSFTSPTVRGSYKNIQPVIAKCKNYVDFLKLFIAFGVRDYANLKTDLNLTWAIGAGADNESNAFYKKFTENLQRITPKG